MSALLKVDNLITCLHDGTRIVDDISFEIEQGETFALLGESGCGKSMTALSLMRLLPDGIKLESGALQLGETDLTQLAEREMRTVRGGGMAMIFQEPGLSLNPVMTVGAQIAEALQLHRGLRGAAAAARSIELLQQVGIPDALRRLHEYPFQMSGGMKQRVMIAMALAGQPRMLIADEPTTALDVTIQAQVLQLLRETQQKNRTALLLITHDLGVVSEMAHRIAVMYAGHIVELATREQLFKEPAHPYTQKLFAALPDARHRHRQLEAIPGSVPPLHDIPRACRFAPRCDRAWDLCREQAPAWTVLENGRGVRCHLYTAGAASVAETESRKTIPLSQGAGDKPASSKEAELLRVSDLRVHFPIHKGILQRTTGYVRAVDGVSLSIGLGRTLALVGESGCGKTTAGKALLQLIRPTTGSVQFAGKELVGLDTQSLRRQRAGMQMVFQDPYASLNPKMRVAEILQEGMEALRVAGSGRERQSRIDDLLGQVGLALDTKWRYPHEFSGGQRQRIAIARTLAVNPQLLICDEPTSALDVSVQAQILNLLKTLQQELQLSYLFITHNLAVVEYLAHEVCVMYLGRIVERGTVEEVMQQARHPYTQALLAAVPRVDGSGVDVVSVAGDMPSPANPPRGCHFHPRCPHAMPQCSSAYPGETRISDRHRVHCHLYGQ